MTAATPATTATPAQEPRKLTPTISMTHDDWDNFETVKSHYHDLLTGIDPAAKQPSDPKVLTTALRIAAQFITERTAAKPANQ